MTEFVKVFKMRGFDRHSSPRWQMVPTVGVRYVALRDGKEHTVRSLDPSVCAVDEILQHQLPTNHGPFQLQANDRVFQLIGKRKGDTLVRAVGPTGITNLEIGVKSAKTLRVGFYFVRDGAVSPHQTIHAPAEATEWLKQMNYVFNGQANVYLVLHDARPIVVPVDLGPRINTYKKKAGPEVLIYPWGDLAGGVNADISVYLVWDLETVDSPGEAVGFRDGTRVFVDDTVKTRVGVTIAHEVGHVLGLWNELHVTRRLMYELKNKRTGVDLSKREVNRIHQ